MLGTVLGLAFAAAFGVNSIITRRGVLRVSSNYIANVSILSGTVFFLLACLVAGELLKLWEFSWQTYLFFALSGIVHFALGRTFGYRAIQLIGSTRSGIVTGLNAIVSVVLAVVILHETLTLIAVLGILLSMTGPILVAFKEQTVSRAAPAKTPVLAGVPSHAGAPANASTNPHPKAGSSAGDVDRRTLVLGLLFGAGSAVFWGSSAIFIKLGLDSGGSSLAGSLIAYVAASIAVTPALSSRRSRKELRASNWGDLRLALMSGMSTNIAQLLRYIALAHASVITVSLMSRTIPLWVLTFAFIFNRQHESFSRWVLVGNGLLLAGTVLVIIDELLR